MALPGRSTQSFDFGFAALKDCLRARPHNQQIAAAAIGAT